MNQKCILGVSHKEGEEYKVVDFLRQRFEKRSKIGIELEDLILEVVLSTLNETIYNPSRLIEILEDIQAPFSFYWANLVVQSCKSNSGLKFASIENRELVEKSIPFLNKVSEKGWDSLSKKQLDKLIQSFVLDREYYFGKMIQEYDLDEVIVGKTHLPYFRKHFPDYKLHSFTNVSYLPDFVEKRIHQMRKNSKLI
jgi:hypothetical protein